MNSTQFIQRLRRHARRTGKTFSWYPGHGKGSHGRATLDGRFTTVKNGEFGSGLLHKMLKDLGVDKKEF